jgi:biopolymer transport protein ExbD
MRRRSRRGKETIDEPAMNLTPLIDVVFVILIIFIVIAPILNVDKVDLAGTWSNPKEQNISLKDNGPITIHVHADNKIYLNNNQVRVDQLAEKLKLEKMKHPGMKPQVYHDKKAHFGTYQSIKNAAEIAGFDEMEIVLRPA